MGPGWSTRRVGSDHASRSQAGDACRGSGGCRGSSRTRSGFRAPRGALGRARKDEPPRSDPRHPEHPRHASHAPSVMPARARRCTRRIHFHSRDAAAPPSTHSRVGTMLWLRTLVFAILVPGTAVVLVPRWIVAQRGAPVAVPGAARVGGAALVAVGAGIMLWCFAEFVARGRGTPAPYDPPRR